MPFARITVAMLFGAFAGRSPATAQRFIRNPLGVDTAEHVSSSCINLRTTQHWQARAKYPVQSEILAAQASDWLRREGRKEKSVDGLITFRFLVDCTGQPSAFSCEQSDAEWMPTKEDFSNAVANELYRFVLSLAPMPLGHVKYPGDKEATPVNYYTYFSFLLKDGIVLSVSP
jgi:hypothetical protein